MPRRSHLRTAGLAAVAALSSPILISCGSGTSSAPNIAPFKQTAGSTTACTTILAQLPKSMHGAMRVKTTGSTFGAAWGSPAIVLRCGVAVPPAFTNNSYASCLTVNGIDWYLDGDHADGAAPNQTLTVTTVYRRPAIEVTIPGSYGTQGPSTAMALLTDVIRAHTKVTGHCL